MIINQLKQSQVNRLIDRDTVHNLKNIIDHLKSTDGWGYFVKYFSDKRNSRIEELVAEAGSITKEDLIEANAVIKLYDELTSFDIVLENELK